MVEQTKSLIDKFAPPQMSCDEEIPSASLFTPLTPKICFCPFAGLYTMKPVSAPLGTLKGRSMEANKRKRPHLGLERRVRVRIEEESSEHELDRSDSEDEAHSRESDGNSSDASGSGDNFEALEPSEDDVSLFRGGDRARHKFFEANE